MDNIDRDHSMTLDHFEFAFNYAAMTHASAEAVFDILDENKDGKLSGKFGLSGSPRTINQTVIDMPLGFVRVK